MPASRAGAVGAIRGALTGVLTRPLGVVAVRPAFGKGALASITGTPPRGEGAAQPANNTLARHNQPILFIFYPPVGLNARTHAANLAKGPQR